MKMGSEVLSFDFSPDGEKLAVALNDCSLLCRSRRAPEELVEQQDPALALFEMEEDKGHIKKDYAYFHRGQYERANEGELLLVRAGKKPNLKGFEQQLRRFDYRGALTSALQGRSVDVIVSLCEELLQRGALEGALAFRSEDELAPLLEFLAWKIGDYRHQGLLLEIASVVADLYSCVAGLSKRTDSLLKKLHGAVATEVAVQKEMIELFGQIELFSQF